MPCAPPPVSDGRSTSSEISESRQAGQAGFTLLRFSGSICSCSSKRTSTERRPRSNILTTIGIQSEIGSILPVEDHETVSHLDHSPSRYSRVVVLQGSLEQPSIPSPSLARRSITRIQRST